MLKSMEAAAQTLPEEIWKNILENGIESSTLGFKELCSFSISCKHFYNLSKDDTLWSLLLTLDFPPLQHFDFMQTFLQSSVQCSNSKKRLYFQVMHDVLRDKLVKHKYEHAVLSRKIKRVRRELRVLDQQLDELSGDLLAMVHDRYIFCHEKLAYLEEAHMYSEREYTRLCAEIKSKGGNLSTFSSNGLEDHRKAGCSEDIEDSFEDESEERDNDNDEDD